MQRQRKRPPTYRHHKASGQARVTLNGVDFYLGPYGSELSKRQYDRVVGEWMAGGRILATPTDGGGVTIEEVLARYWVFATLHYRNPDGITTKELENIRYSIRPLRRLYGATLVHEFGPVALKAIRQGMVDDGLSRPVVNSRVSRIKRVFRWAVSEQLCPSPVLQSLQAVAGLQKGRTEAREPSPIKPADDAQVDATIGHLPAVVADMVRFQRLVGCRPGEVCQLRPGDVDRSETIWKYTPLRHKSEHHGHARLIFIGPRAQKILRPYLLRAAGAYCFSPSDSERRRKREMREKRKSKVQPSQVNRAKPQPVFRPGDRYDKSSYARAIHRGCDKAFPPSKDLNDEERRDWIKAHRWSPNRLRHAAATEIRKKFGLEAAQVILGHSRADVTQVYAERDGSLAARVMGEVG